MNDTKTVSGAIVHITDADEAPLVKCLVDITPKQSGTGTPSPDNVRPISGWECVSVTDVGKNLLPPYATSQTKNGITFTVNEDGTITANGTATATTVLYLSAYVDTWANGTYILNGCPSAGGDGKYCLRMYKTGGTTYVSDVGNGVTFEGQNQLECAIVIWKNQVLSNLTFKPMIRVSGASAEYEPYNTNSHTTTTSLGRTVYGGTLDVVSGVLKVTHAYLNYNGSENWQADSGRYTIGVSGSYREGYTRIPVTSNEGVFGTGSSVGTIFLSNTQLYYYPPTSVTSLADFKTWLSSNNLQVVYPLATPQTYTLTGQEVSAMYGENYIWASSGPVEITYRTNVLGIYNKIYINGRPYFRPNDFQLAREDVYAGEYTSCTGKLIADKIGWRYSDLPMKWDILPDEDLVYLTTLTGSFDITFRDSDGQHTETVIRRGFTNTPTRTTGPEGSKIWTGVEMEVSFLNTHSINE